MARKKKTIAQKNKPAMPEVVADIASQAGINADELWGYMQEDTQQGNDEGNPFGTSFGFEGRILYGLIRALKSQRVLEVGTHHGGGTNHLAAALARNGSGQVTTVDINPTSGGHFLPPLAPYIHPIVQDANLYIPTVTEPFDFIFEDGNHSEYQVHVIYQNLRRILSPGGYIISHDALVEGMGEYIRNGIIKSGIPLEQVKFYNTSRVGLCIYQRGK